MVREEREGESEGEREGDSDRETNSFDQTKRTSPDPTPSLSFSLSSAPSSITSSSFATSSSSLTHLFSSYPSLSSSSSLSSTQLSSVSFRSGNTLTSSAVSTADASALSASIVFGVRNDKRRSGRADDMYVTHLTSLSSLPHRPHFESPVHYDEDAGEDGRGVERPKCGRPQCGRYTCVCEMRKREGRESGKEEGRRVRNKGLEGEIVRGSERGTEDRGSREGEWGERFQRVKSYHPRQKNTGTHTHTHSFNLPPCFRYLALFSHETISVHTHTQGIFPRGPRRRRSYCRWR